VVVITLLAIVLGGNAAYHGWKNRKASDPLKKLGGGMYQPAEPGGETLPLPTNAAGSNTKIQNPKPK
jgi:hypothetical protein